MTKCIKMCCHQQSFNHHRSVSAVRVTSSPHSSAEFSIDDIDIFKQWVDWLYGGEVVSGVPRSFLKWLNHSCFLSSVTCLWAYQGRESFYSWSQRFPIKTLFFLWGCFSTQCLSLAVTIQWSDSMDAKLE